jgi:hypothetical protein
MRHVYPVHFCAPGGEAASDENGRLHVDVRFCGRIVAGASMWHRGGKALGGRRGMGEDVRALHWV